MWRILLYFIAHALELDKVLLNSNGFVWILINIHWDSSVKYTTINKVRRPLSCLRLDKLDSSIHCAITTNTTIWKPGLRFGFLMHHNIAFVFKKWQLLFSSRLLLFSGLLPWPLRCLLPLDPSQHSMRTHDHGQCLKKYCIIQQDT